jgi:hypothetical protein
VSAPGGTRHALRFGAALRYFWTSRRAGEEVANLFGPVLARPEARSDLKLYVDAALTVLDGRSTAAARPALRFGEQVVEAAREAGDPRLLAEALGQLCGLYYFAGEPGRGSPFGAEAVQLARQAGDDVLLGITIMGYLLCQDLIDPADAWRLYAEGIACAQRSGDRQTAHVLHNNAAVHAIRAGDFAAARAHLLETAQAGAEIGQRNDAVPVNMGWVLRHEQDSEAARTMFESGLRISRRTGDSYVMAYCSLGLACTLGDLGDLRRAAEMHGVARAFGGRLGGPWQQPEEQYRHESIEQIRAQLGAEQFDAAYRRGMRLTFDDAVTLALGPVGEAAA